MKAYKFRFWILVAIAVTAAAAVGAVTRVAEPHSAALHDSPYDLSYIDMMMMHHQNGIGMFRMAETKSQLAQLKDFARKGIAAQQKDIAELQGYRDRFYPNERKADKMQMGAMMLTEAEMARVFHQKMRKLEAASASDFDHLFLDLMTKHHQMALRMSEDAQKKAEHAEVREFAGTTIAKQGEEIKEMARLKQLSMRAK
jgi:uncharacterized protein (DUF305 family)